MLLYVLLAVLGWFLIQFLWSRRKFYWLSWRMQGPLAYPLIGNAHNLINQLKVMGYIQGLSAKYKGWYRFWLGPRFLVMCHSPDVFEEVMNSPHAMDKGAVYQIVGNVLGGHGLITSSGNEWKGHRKLLNPTIQNFKILNSFYPTFNRNMRVLVERIQERCGQGEFDAYGLMETCSVDMICETTFGINMHVQDGENRDFLEHANNILDISGLLILQPWYQIETIFRMSKWHAIEQRSRYETRTFALNIIDKKIAEYEHKAKSIATSGGGADNNNFPDTDGMERKKLNNFIDECVRLTQEEKCFSRTEMVNESVTMLLGGFETTAITAAHIVMMLAMHPEYQQQVFDELRNIIPDQTSDVTAEQIGQLDFTNRFIKETMRLLPTVPFVSRIAKQDFDIKGETIPEGTELVMCICSLHRNADVWGPTAETFHPDHFLPENMNKRHPYAFIPFSAGPRNCIGLKYAHIVVRMFVCWLVRNFRFTTDMRMEDLKFRMSITMKLANGHMVRAHRREEY